MRAEIIARCCVLALAFNGAAAAAKLDRAKLGADAVVIGEIRILADDIFDVERPDENRFVYRLANRLHVETREGTVARLLLFKVGEPYRDQLIRESERLLRQRRWSERTTTHARLDAQIGKSLDLDQLVSLGGDNGLRGYPYRYANGERSAVLTLEQRYYSDWYPGRLFRVGAAAFVDIGRSWGDLPEGPENLGTLRDVGIGLRLVNTRSSGAHVIHIDLAHPLDGSGDIDQLQLLVSTRRSF